MSEVSITDWQTNDIAIYTPKEPSNKRAFEDWFPEIINAGFRIYELTLSEAYCSDNQIIFKKENIILKKDITNEFN